MEADDVAIGRLESAETLRQDLIHVVDQL